MPGARSGGTGGDSSQSGGYSGDASGAVTVWEVVSLLGKLLGTVAALKVVLYLLRVCLAMAWKSGGASHSELIHNLRSKCHPRPMWGNWARLGLDWVPLGRPERSVCPPPAPPSPARYRLEGSAQGCTSSLERHALAIASLRTCHSSATWTRREKKATGCSWWGRSRRLPAGLGEGSRHRWWGCHSSQPPVRPGLAGEGRALGVGRCWRGLEAGLHLRGPHPRPPHLLAFLLLNNRPRCEHSLPH